MVLGIIVSYILVVYGVSRNNFIGPVVFGKNFDRTSPAICLALLRADDGGFYTVPSFSETECGVKRNCLNYFRK